MPPGDTSVGARTWLAVFDCDGTLVDSQVSICEAMETAFAECALPAPDRARVRRAVGLSLPQAMRVLLPDAPEGARAALVDAYKRAFRAARERGDLSQALFPGMSELIEQLAGAGWSLAVATGMSHRGLVHCLETHGLSAAFGSLQTADAHPSKPHPAMLEAALADFGATPGEAVMIGDTAFDIAMAASIGVRAVGVDWGYHAADELLAAGAECVVNSPAQLAEYLSHAR